MPPQTLASCVVGFYVRSRTCCERKLNGGWARIETDGANPVRGLAPDKNNLMSVERDQLREGVYVRLLSDWSSVPRGTTGKIGIATSNEGFRSTVMWDSYLAIPVFFNPKKRQRKLVLSGLPSYSLVADENLHMLEEEAHVVRNGNWFVDSP